MAETRFEGTKVGNIIDYVKASSRPDVHRLGETILGMSGETADELNEGIHRIIELTQSDFGKHDVTIGLNGGGGITIHCAQSQSQQDARKLTSHCAMRKYVQKADRWYGVLINTDGIPAAMVGIETPWAFDARLEKEAGPFRVRNVTHSLSGCRKIGRNDPCPCGSGKKYKKCCLN